MKTQEFMTVKEAADLLGVSPNTIRSWGSNGKLAEYRHPVNNYRLFKRKEVTRLREQIENPKPKKSKPR